MPQIDFFFDEDDETVFLTYLVGKGFWFVSNRLYLEPQYEEFSDVRRYHEIKETTKKSLFILHKDFVTCPLEMRQLKKGTAEGKYYIMPRNGGPAFDYLCPGTYFDHGCRVIAPGILGYYETYWNTKLNRNENTPKSQKEAFKMMKSFIKSNSVPSIPKGFHVGSHAALEHSSGRAKLRNSRKYPYTIDTQEKKNSVN